MGVAHKTLPKIYKQTNIISAASYAKVYRLPLNLNKWRAVMGGFEISVKKIANMQKLPYMFSYMGRNRPTIHKG